MKDLSSRLRVGIASSGRFHLLDLARELDALDIDVSFYSYVPRKRAYMFGLPRRCYVPLLPFLFPLVAWEWLLPQMLPRVVEMLMCWALDTLVIIRMRRCDLFICMSGMYVLAPRFAKWRYGAKVILHRASRHILSQREILLRIPNAQQVTDFMVKRELQGYDIADQIAVPSSHVAESFAPWPEHSKKLSQNPYGVDTSQFPLRDPTRLSDTPTILYVGHWSYRKGVDVLVEAASEMGAIRIVHVGTLMDAPFPNDPRYTHQDPVSQQRLTDFYREAHVFVLASREDGFGYVLSQALSSGLQVVCTDRTGGPDLARLPGLARFIRVVPSGDPLSLRTALRSALEDAMGKSNAVIAESERQMLSWSRYAIRELELMKKLETLD